MQRRNNAKDAGFAGTCDISLNEGVYYVSGDLRFSTVMDLDKKAKRLFGQAPTLNLNFSRISSSDSAGLALIIEWVKFAGQRQQAIKINDLPQNLMQIAKASGLDHLLLT
jgi:phospholipid transport system transporter-binding protein